MLICASPMTQPLPTDVHIAASAAEALTWLIDLPVPATSVTPSPEPAGFSLVIVEPPPSPEAVLQTLEKGGNVPAVLREKLLGKR